MKKYAWTWNVKPEYVEEYVNMHKNPWPEIMQAHSDAGIKNYSIFRNANQFFYVLECENIEKVNAYMADNPDCQRWNNITSKMVEGSFDLKKEGSISYLEEVFFLK